MSPRIILEIAFAIIIVVFLVVDLGILNRRAHAITVRAAAWQSVFWVTVSLIFAASMFLFYDALEFFDDMADGQASKMEFLRA